MCSKNTSHLEASPQEARITLAGDTFSGFVRFSFLLRKRHLKSPVEPEPGVTSNTQLSGKAEAPATGRQALAAERALGAFFLPAPGKVSVLAGHKLHGALCLWPPSLRQQLQKPGRRAQAPNAADAGDLGLGLGLNTRESG